MANANRDFVSLLVVLAELTRSVTLRKVLCQHFVEYQIVNCSWIMVWDIRPGARVAFAFWVGAVALEGD